MAVLTKGRALIWAGRREQKKARRVYSSVLTQQATCTKAWPIAPRAQLVVQIVGVLSQQWGGLIG